jgi:hypothetical protein
MHDNVAKQRNCVEAPNLFSKQISWGTRVNARVFESRNRRVLRIKVGFRDSVQRSIKATNVEEQKDPFLSGLAKFLKLVELYIVQTHECKDPGRQL